MAHRAPRFLMTAALVAALLGTSLITSAGAADVGLADRAPDRLAVGGVLHSYDPGWDDGLYATTAATEFDAITATAYMPFGVHPTPNLIITEPLEQVTEWARERDLRVHGHPLLYPLVNQRLDWYTDLEGGHRDVLENYVRTVAGSTAGDVWVWDVVNELFADPGDPQVDGRGLRTSYVEYDVFNGNYDDVFRWAREADPNAKLILNDYGAEELTEKADNILAEVIAMRDRGVPIDGVGFQFHLGTDPDFWSIRQNLQRFADAGFDLYITEVDVEIVNRPSGDAPLTRDERLLQRAIFEEVTRIALEQPAVKSLLLWDFADERSWLHPARDAGGPVPQGLYAYPTIFNEPSIGEELRPKAGYRAMIEAFEDHLDNPIRRSDTRRLQVENGADELFFGRGAAATSNEVPGDGTFVGELTPAREDWLSLQWTFEPVGDNVFRIRSAWPHEDGTYDYLTRVGRATGGGNFEPTDQIGFEELNPNWPSQQWRLERLGNFRFRVINMWEPHTGALTNSADGPSLELSGAPENLQSWKIPRL